MKTQQYSAWRYLTFVLVNVLIVFVAAWTIDVVWGQSSMRWLEALVATCAFNLVVLPIHLRKSGPVWFTPAHGPLDRVWTALLRFVGARKVA